MIEENTVALTEVASPSLDELGLAPEEQRQLEKLGVRNAAQLQRLNTSSGEDAVARFADVPVNRLRAALQAGRPPVDRIASSEPERPVLAGGEARPRAVPEVRVPAGHPPAAPRRPEPVATCATAGSAQLDGAGVRSSTPAPTTP